MKIQDSYVMSEPSQQNILDIFQGEWSSKLPDKFNLVTAPATAALFEDERVEWAENVFNSFKNFDILELGPLEAGHTYMFEQKHAKKITSIEANSRAFLKCLAIKEVLNLEKVEFKLGNFMPFLESCDSSYDLVFASGVLYHMNEPIELLHSISKITNRIFIWTHYYDQAVMQDSRKLKKHFKPGLIEYEGHTYEYASQKYRQALKWAGFCGGPEPTSKWLSRESIIQALQNFGFTDITINFEDKAHQNGPAFALCATKPASL